ncbi:DNA polymerase [Entamoeba marina]
MLFGKVSNQSNFVSCCIRIKGIPRMLFVQPKNENSSTNQVLKELQSFYNNKNVKLVIKTKEFVVNPYDDVNEKQTIQRKSVSGVEVQCTYDDKELPDSGKFYSKVYEKSITIEESFLMKTGIMGPSWIEITGAKKLEVDEHKSWCHVEYLVNMERSKITPNETSIKSTPPITVCSVSSLCRNEENNKKTPLIVSLDIVKQVPITHRMKSIRHNTYTYYISSIKGVVGTKCASVEELVINVAKCMHVNDVDCICAHDLSQTFNAFFDSMINSSQNSIKEMSKFGRFKRSKIEKQQERSDGSFSYYKYFAGRLLADTFLLTKIFLRSEKINDLDTLVTSYLKKQRTYKVIDWDCQSELDKLLSNEQTLTQLTRYIEENSTLVIDLCNAIEAIPLTKELTSLAGNIWSHSLLGKTAERVEYLLLHKFSQLRNTLILPDKIYSIKQKKKFEGGLVLEPTRGFYSDHILLLDFKSLYPSIIREFNICLMNTTLGDTSTKSILPGIIKTLVDRRREIVAEQNKTTDPIKNALLETKQKSVKVMTNSIFGCLGFQGSRFYCQKLAEFITLKGRLILMDTCELISNKGLNVIYGDTDGLMIQLPKTTTAALYQTGNRLCDEINAKYKTLEIEIDAVFSKLLLLRKKRYAATIISPDNQTKRELKGLDVVRREWCPLSKEVGYYVINLVLSDPGLESLEKTLRDYFTKLATNLRSGAIAYDQLVITKGLSKDLKSYTQKIEHVAAALKSSKQYKAGDQVHYVISSIGGDSVVDRAIPLDVVEKTPNFQPDYSYYLESQIYSPTARLLEVLPGFQRMLREWLGLSVATAGSSSKNTTIFADCNGFDMRCTICKRQFYFMGYAEKDTENRCKCPHCKTVFKGVDLLSHIHTSLDAFVSNFLDQNIVCSVCDRSYMRSDVVTDVIECCGQEMRFDKQKVDVMNELTHMYTITSWMLNGLDKPESDIESVNSIVKEYLDKAFLQRSG